MSSEKYKSIYFREYLLAEILWGDVFLIDMSRNGKIGVNLNALSHISDIIIPLLLFYIVGYGVVSKVKVYEAFLTGAKEGLKVVADIMPTLVGLLVAATEPHTLFPPNITCMVNRDVIGIITKINDPKANVPLAELWLRNAGCRDIFSVDSVTGEGVEAILAYLNQPKNKTTETE